MQPHHRTPRWSEPSAICEESTVSAALTAHLHATCNVQRATCQMHACFGYITLTMLRRARGSVCGLTLRWQLHVACRMLHAACMLLACMYLACMYLGVRCAHIIVCVSGLACPIRLHRACATQGLHCMLHCMLHEVHRMFVCMSQRTAVPPACATKLGQRGRCCRTHIRIFVAEQSAQLQKDRPEKAGRAQSVAEPLRATRFCSAVCARAVRRACACD